MKSLYILLIAVYANSMSGIVSADDGEVASILLTPSNFDAEIKDRNYLVAFFTPECPVSQRFLQIYEDLAKSLNAHDGLRLGRVDCDEHLSLCSSQGVKGLDIQLYQAGKDTIKYTGVKDKNGVTKFLVKILGTDLLENKIDLPESLQALNELTDETFADHVATGYHFVKFYAPWCGHCQSLAPVWEELANSLEYDSTVSISKVDCTLYRPICQEFEVKGYPTMLWIENGKKVEKYSDRRQLAEFKAFVERKTGAAVQQQPTEKPAATAAPIAHNDGHEEEVNVVQLTGSNFEQTIGHGVTIVKFFAPWCGHCKRLVPTWNDLAGKYVGNRNVKVAKVDCTLADNKELCSQQEVDGFPTIFIYKNGDKITEYNGNRSLDDLVNFINRHRSEHEEL